MFKFLFLKFSPPHRSTLIVFKCRKICPTENRWNRALFAWPKKNKIFSCLSNCH